MSKRPGLGNGNSSPPRPSFSEGVARRVLDACRRSDPQAQISYVGRDENERTRVRVRSSNGCSVQSLQKVLKELMPFAAVRTSESVLDGSVQAEIIVPTGDDEYKLAYGASAQQWSGWLLQSAAAVLLLLGTGMWLSTLLDATAGDI